MSAVNSKASASAEKDNMYSLRWDHYQASRTSGFLDLLEDPEYSMTDVTLACQGEFIQAHKLVLAVSSPFFKQFFKMNRVERSGTTLIALANVEFKDLQNVVQFMYNGEVHLPNADVKSFLETAKMLQIHGLTENSKAKTKQMSEVWTSVLSVPSNESSYQPTPSKRPRSAAFSDTAIRQDEEPAISEQDPFSRPSTSRIIQSALQNEAQDETAVISIDVKSEFVEATPMMGNPNDMFYDEDVGEDVNDMSESLSFDQVNFSSNYAPGPSTRVATATDRGNHSNKSGRKSGDYIGRCYFCPKEPGRQKRSSRKRCESCARFVCANETCRKTIKTQNEDGSFAITIFCIKCSAVRGYGDEII